MQCSKTLIIDRIDIDTVLNKVLKTDFVACLSIATERIAKLIPSISNCTIRVFLPSDLATGSWSFQTANRIAVLNR